MTWLFSCWLPCQWLLPGVVLRQGAPLLCAATAAAAGGAWTASAVSAPARGWAAACLKISCGGRNIVPGTRIELRVVGEI